MDHEKLCNIKDKVIDLIEYGLSQEIKDINSKEIYELMDIVKDVEEAIYYSKVVESMEEYPEVYEKKYAQRYRDRMYYSSMHEKTLDEHIDELMNMMNEMSSEDKATAKQKLTHMVSKL